MKTFWTLSFIVAFCAVCYVYYKRQQRLLAQPKVIPVTLESELKMMDIVGYFRSLEIRKGEDIPFMANLRCDSVSQMLAIHCEIPEGYQALLLGTCKEHLSSDLHHVKIIFCRSLEQKIQESLSGNGLTILS